MNFGSTLKKKNYLIISLVNVVIYVRVFMCCCFFCKILSQKLYTLVICAERMNNEGRGFLRLRFHLITPKD